ncbi:MAG: DUF2007 domain-containing protein [Rikenellaceae bacterium]
MEGMSLIYSSLSLQNAYVAKAHLESAGIEVFMQDELTTQVYTVGVATGGVKLFVKEEDVKVSLIVLNESGVLRQDNSPETEVECFDAKEMTNSCPFCHSKNIKLPKKSKFKRYFAAFVSLLMAAPIQDGSCSNSYECFDCGKLWRYN